MYKVVKMISLDMIENSCRIMRSLRDCAVSFAQAFLTCTPVIIVTLASTQLLLMEKTRFPLSPSANQPIIIGHEMQRANVACNLHSIESSAKDEKRRVIVLAVFHRGLNGSHTGRSVTAF